MTTRSSMCVLCAELLQLCLTLCDPMDCIPSGSSAHEDSPGKNTGVGCHALLQEIFPTQGSNPHLLCFLHWGNRVCSLSMSQWGSHHSSVLARKLPWTEGAWMATIQGAAKSQTWLSAWAESKQLLTNLYEKRLYVLSETLLLTLSMILFEKHAFKRNFLKLYQELSFRPYSPMRDFFSTGPERLNPFFLPGGDKRLSLPGREWERVLAASPAKPALEKWFGRNICGPELSATMYQGGVSCTRFSLVSWTKAKMGSWACT